MTASDLLLVFISGLCPLSFLAGMAVVFLALLKTGTIGHYEVKRLDGIRPRDFDFVAAREWRDGWQFAGVVAVRVVVQGEAEDTRLLDLYFRKWRLT